MASGLVSKLIAPLGEDDLAVENPNKVFFLAYEVPRRTADRNPEQCREFEHLRARDERLQDPTPFLEFSEKPLHERSVLHDRGDDVERHGNVRDRVDDRAEAPHLLEVVDEGRRYGVCHDDGIAFLHEEETAPGQLHALVSDLAGRLLHEEAVEVYDEESWTTEPLHDPTQYPAYEHGIDENSHRNFHHANHPLPLHCIQFWNW